VFCCDDPAGAGDEGLKPSSEEEGWQENHAREERWRQQMRAAQDGDKAAYETLLTDIMPLLRAVVQRTWRNPHDVEDIVQDVLLSLHVVRHTYDPTRPFVPWLLTIARRRIADTARRSSSRSAHETTVEVLPETFSGDATKNEQEGSDDQAAIRTALAGLTGGQREAVELLKVQGLSLNEASAITGKSVAALKINVHRGLKALRRKLTAKT
jgi:RNA polymerase sigma-70 factor (ECF subfamily)